MCFEKANSFRYVTIPLNVSCCDSSELCLGLITISDKQQGEHSH